MVQFSALFDKYADWKLLRFLLETSTSVHVKEAARKAGVSQGTASRTLDFLRKAGVAEADSIGNLKRYRLADSPLMRELKILAGLTRLDDLRAVERFLEEDGSIATIALYGSFASGEFDSRSDMDLLIVSNGRCDFSRLLASLEKGFGREVTLLQYTVSELSKARDKDPVFYANLRANHIILYGAKLP